MGPCRVLSPDPLQVPGQCAIWGSNGFKWDLIFAESFQEQGQIALRFTWVTNLLLLRWWLRTQFSSSQTCMTLPLPRILINHPIEQPSYYIGGLLSSKWAIPDFINSKLGWFISLYNVYIYIYILQSQFITINVLMFPLIILASFQKWKEFTIAWICWRNPKNKQYRFPSGFRIGTITTHQQIMD